MPNMIYRSPLTRYVLAVIGLVTGVIFAFGDGHKWRSTPSLHWLAQAPIPLQAWGVALIVYAVLLVSPRTRPVGYALGAFVYLVFTVSLLATLHPSSPDPKNIVTVGAMIDVIVLHLFLIRVSEAIRLSA